MEASQWAPLETSDIEGRLGSIQLRVRKWSTEHAMLTFDQIADPKGFSNIIRALATRGCVMRPDELHECLMTTKSMRKPGKASAVLLSAGVMHEIMRTIIANPYFAFLGRPGEYLLQGDQADALANLTAYVATCTL